MIGRHWLWAMRITEVVHCVWATVHDGWCLIKECSQGRSSSLPDEGEKLERRSFLTIRICLSHTLSAWLACGVFMLKSHCFSAKNVVRRLLFTCLRAPFSSLSAPTKLNPLSHLVMHCTSYCDETSKSIDKDRWKADRVYFVPVKGGNGFIRSDGRSAILPPWGVRRDWERHHSETLCSEKEAELNHWAILSFLFISQYSRKVWLCNSQTLSVFRKLP